MKLIIKDRKRFRSFVFCCIGILLFVFAVAISQGAAGETQIKNRVINVKKGDSIWKIARGLPKYQDESIDARVIVNKIMQINGINSPVIYEHQALLVPIIE